MAIRINRTIFLILTSLTTLCIFVSIKADSKPNIELSPPYVDISLKSEENFTGSFSITNNTDDVFSLTLLENDYVNEVILEPKEKWIEIEYIKDPFYPRQKREIKYKVSIPPNTDPGKYTKLISVNLLSETASARTYTMSYKVNISVGSLFADTSGNIIASADLENKLLINSDTNLRIEIGNASEISSTRPLINVNIVNSFGQIVYSKTLNESLALFDSKKIFNLPIEIPNTGLNFLGQYQVQILVTDTLTNKSVIKTITFFYVNKFIVLLIILIVLASLVLFKFAKGFRNFIQSQDIDGQTSIGKKKISKNRSANNK